MPWLFFLLIIRPAFASGGAEGDVTSTTECLTRLGNAEAGCSSFLNSPAVKTPECVSALSTLLLSEIFEGTDCVCNLAIQGVIPGLAALAGMVGCQNMSTYEYGCAEPDQIVDLNRFNQLARLRDATQLDQEALKATIHDMFDHHAVVEFISAGVYHGIDMVTEYIFITLPTINAGAWVWGPALEILSVTADSGGLTTVALVEERWLSGTDVANLPPDEHWDYYKKTSQFGMVMGRWARTEFLECSAIIKTFTMGLDKTSKDAFFHLQSVTPKYNEQNYCKTVMEHCVGENAQFASEDECLQYNEDYVPLEDAECMAMDLSGLGNSKYCKMLHQWMVPIPGGQAHCFHTGIGGLDPTGGKHCYAGECAGGITPFNADMLATHEHWLAEFDDMGTHECINGIWKASYYMHRWVKPFPRDVLSSAGNLDVGFDCFVLGRYSYFKLIDEVTGSRKFELLILGDKIEGEIRVEDNVDGKKSIKVFRQSIYATSSDVTLVRLEPMLEFEVPVGVSEVSECLPLLALEICVSSPDGALEIAFKVDGETRKAIKLMDETYQGPSVLELSVGAEASAKLSNLVSLTGADRSPQPGLNAKEIFFKTSSDEYLLESAQTQSEMGVVAQVRFEWTEEGRSAGYTGLFERADHCLMRISAVSEKETADLAGGVAVKCLRDGVASGDIITMWSPAGFSNAPHGYAGSCRIFGVPYMNHATFKDLLDADVRKSLQVDFSDFLFSRADAMNSNLGLSHFAEYTQEGAKADEMNFPFAVMFVPTAEVQELPCSWGEEYDATGKNPDLYEGLSQARGIKPGMNVFDVYAVKEPWAEQSGEPDLLKLGTLKATSEADFSRFGDEHLFFQHNLFQEVTAVYPQWADADLHDLPYQSAARYAEYLGLEYNYKTKLPFAGSTTEECVRRIADVRAECVTALSLGTTSSPEDCNATVQALDLEDSTSCSCNTAIRSFFTISGDCSLAETFEYGCEASDESVDAQRFDAVAKFKAALSMMPDAALAELQTVFASDIRFEFIGIGTYVGASEVLNFLQMMNPAVSSVVLSGSTVELKSFEIGPDGFRIVALDSMSAFAESLKFMQGSFNSLEFLPCSGTISAIGKMVDDFTFKTLGPLQAGLPEYNEKKYCRTLMDVCTGDAAQFSSYDECVAFNEESVPVFDTSCPGAYGFGDSRFCRMILQYAISDGDASSCSRLGSGVCTTADCDYRSLYKPEMLLSGKKAIMDFETLGSHECIDGLWASSVYLYTWQSPVADAIQDGTSRDSSYCLVLGKKSYFKITKKVAEGSMKQTYDFVLHYSTAFRDFGLQGVLEYGLTSEDGNSAVTVTFMSDEQTIADVTVPFGDVRCLAMTGNELCTSFTGADSTDGRRLADEKQVKLYVKVDDKETESIVVMREGNIASTTSNTDTLDTAKAEPTTYSVAAFASALFAAGLFSW